MLMKTNKKRNFILYFRIYNNFNFFWNFPKEKVEIIINIELKYEHTHNN